VHFALLLYEWNEWFPFLHACTRAELNVASPFF
jgi:hypothetical protein